MTSHCPPAASAAPRPQSRWGVLALLLAVVLLGALPARASHDCFDPTNLLANCSFQSGDLTAWEAVDIAGPFYPLGVGGAGLSPGFGLFTSAPEHDDFAVVHGFDGSAPGVIEVFQETTLGADPFLRFGYRAGWDLLNYAPATLDRTFEVVIEPVGGGAPLYSQLILTAAADSVNLDTGDLEATVDLSAFAATPVRIKFLWTVPEASTGPAFFQLENVLVDSAFVIDNGDPANRLDIAIFGDGYTDQQLSDFANDVDQFMQDVLMESPYDEYAPYINVHRVEVASAESGADHPEDVPQLFVDTAFDAAYDCAGIERLICVDVLEVLGVATVRLDPDERDIILVLVNDAEYGGSGGAIAVASTHAAAVDLILHETGHSFGLLADEYTTNPPPCNSTLEPGEPNTTKQTVRAQIKWNAWIDPLTPIPTTSTAPAVPGLYQGSKYCNVDLYRPTHNSLMRSLGVPFEQINSEQLVKRIYNWVSPIEAVSPGATNLSMDASQSQLFSVAVPQPATHSLDTVWSVNGIPVASGATQHVFDAATVGVGTHTLEVLVSDATPLVRNDPSQALLESHSWVIQVPEPSVPMQLVPGIVALFGLDARRRRRVR